MTVVDLRRAEPADSELCYAVHKLAMRAYVEAIWGWDEAVQRDFHDRGFDPEGGRVIVVDGADAGYVDIDYRADEVYLGRIELLPDYQGRGVGTTVLRRVLREAGDLPVTLDVLVVNPRARALYERLGFREIGRHGDDNIKIRMSCPAVNRG